MFQAVRLLLRSSLLTYQPTGVYSMKKPVQPTTPVQLLTINQVAARLAVHRTTVYDYINLAGLPVTRLSPKAVRIDERDLCVWIEQKKAAS
jgi:excisionase family DNA binding protein